MPVIVCDVKRGEIISSLKVKLKAIVSRFTFARRSLL